MDNEKGYTIKRREYPRHDLECTFPMPEAMFPVVLLREAYDYYCSKIEVSNRTAFGFLNYLLRLEKDVPISQQKAQP